MGAALVGVGPGVVTVGLGLARGADREAGAVLPAGGTAAGPVSAGSSLRGIPTVVVPGPIPVEGPFCPSRRLCESPSDPAIATAAITAQLTASTARPRRHAPRRDVDPAAASPVSTRRPGRL